MISRLVKACAIVALCGTSSFAQRPTAPQLFTDTTFAYARINDVRELVKKWNETSFGRLLADPEVAPLVQELYGSLLSSAKQVEEQAGMPVDEMLTILQGELAFGIMQGEAEGPPTICFLLEAKDRLSDVQTLFERIRKNNGQPPAKVYSVGSIQVSDTNPNAEENRSFLYFMHDGVMVGSNSRSYIEHCAQLFEKTSVEHKPLAQKTEFLDIMTRCAGTQGERPQISFYVDPIGIFKEVSKSNPAALFIFPILTSLGVDGIKGVGGSYIMAPAEFDAIAHFHLSLASPRKGVLSAIRPSKGSIDPETWVAEDVASYLTLNWNVQSTLSAVEQLYDTFQGPGLFKANVLDAASRELGLDFKKDLLDQIDGRLTTTSVFVRPLRINSQSNVYAIKLKNAKKFEDEVLPKFLKLAERGPGKFKEIEVSGHKVYHLEVKQMADGPRQPDPAITFLDDRIIISDSLQALEGMCETYGNGEGLLLESLEYKIINQRVAAQASGQELFGITISRPEESLRTFYDLAADKGNRQKLAEMSAMNPMLAALSKTLEKHELPTFDVIRKHMAPGGGFFSEDDTGLHFTTFGIKRK
jgi:hypothetical protein